MSKKTTAKNIASLAVAATMAVGFSNVANAEAHEKEKCYGVAKAAKNDCGNSRHSCAGQSTKDGQGDEWIYLTKGICERLVGGSLTPIAEVSEDASGEVKDMNSVDSVNDMMKDDAKNTIDEM